MDYLSLIGQLDGEAWLRAAVAFVLCALAMPLALPLARRWRLLDNPGGRKDHEGSVPVVGGLVIYFTVVLSLLVFEGGMTTRMWAFVAGAGLLVLVGQLDDYFDLRWTWRIGAQALAALLMATQGGVVAMHLQDVFGHAGANMGLLAIPFTLFIVVGVINALNMADGVDGLAGSLSVVALVLYTAYALYAGNVVLAERLLAMATAVMGFLVWNARLPWQPRARVFLGNGGSMLLGFVIAWTAVRGTHNPVHPVSPLLGPWTIALPLIDCVALIIRRLWQGRSPFSADRHHMHHLLLDAGFRPGQIVLGLGIVSLLLGLGAGLAVKAGVYRPAMVALFFVLIGLWLWFTRDYDRAVARVGRWRRALGGAPAAAERAA